MSIATVAPGIRDLADDDLLAAYRDADDAARGLVLAEAARRDRLAEQAAKREQVRAEWRDAAYADYLAAEAECRGELVNRAGVAAGVRDGFALWCGPRSIADKYATEELREWWLTHPRITVSEYAAQRAAGMRAARLEAYAAATDAEDTTEDTTTDTEGFTDEQDSQDRTDHAGAVDGAAPVRLRHGSAADSVRLERDGQQHGDAEAGQVRHAGPVQPGRRVMMLTNFADVAPRETMLLSQRPYLPYGEVSMIYGSGSLGKGRMVQSIIAAVTNGQPVGLDESTDDDAGDVIVILPEDKQGESAVKRLIASGADLSRVWDMTRLDGGVRFKLSATPRDPGHLPELRAAIAQLRADGRNPRLLVIDPLGACVGEGTILTSKGARHLIESLQDLAEQTGICLLVVAHPVTGGKLQGSWALQQALRSVFYVSRDDSNPDVRVLRNVKGNDVPPGLAADVHFTIVDSPRGPHAEWLKPGQPAPQGQPRSRDWRDDLAERRARKATATVPASRPQTYTVLMSTGRGAVRLAERVASPEQARRICESTEQAKLLAAAGQPLVWRETEPGTWRAGNRAVAFGIVAVPAASAV